MTLKYRNGILCVSTGLLFVLLVVFLTKKPSDAAEHARLLKLTDACNRIQSGSISLEEWSIALLHCARPKIYFEEEYCRIQKRLWDSGYITYRELHVTNLMERSTALGQAIQNCNRTNISYCRIQLNFANECVEIWCRKQDVPIWEKALADFGTPVLGQFGGTRR